MSVCMCIHMCICIHVHVCECMHACVCECVSHILHSDTFCMIVFCWYKQSDMMQEDLCAFLCFADRQREEKRLQKQREKEKQREGIDDTWADRFVPEAARHLPQSQPQHQLPPPPPYASGGTMERSVTNACI